MPSKNRRTVSMTAALYNRIAAHCDALGISRGGWVVKVVTEALDRERAPREARPAPRKPGGPQASR